VWSDEDIEAMMEDVTLGHERRPIPIDMSEVDGGPNGKREGGRERERERDF
jgi:hypothetical protein